MLVAVAVAAEVAVAVAAAGAVAVAGGREVAVAAGGKVAVAAGKEVAVAAEVAAEVEAAEAELKLLRAQLRQLVDRSLFLPLSPCSRIPLTRLTAHPRMCYALALLPTRTTCITDCVGRLCSWRSGCSLRAGSSGMSLVQVKDRVAQLRARIAVVQSRAAAHGV